MEVEVRLGRQKTIRIASGGVKPPTLSRLRYRDAPLKKVIHERTTALCNTDIQFDLPQW
jgi:hypothetical protein